MGLFRICAYQLVHSLPSVDTSRDNIRISRDNLFNFCFQKKKYHKCTQEVSSLVFTVCNHQKGTFQNSVRIVSSMDSYLPLLHIFTTCLYYMTLLLRYLGSIIDGLLLAQRRVRQRVVDALAAQLVCGGVCLCMHNIRTQTQRQTDRQDRQTHTHRRTHTHTHTHTSTTGVCVCVWCECVCVCVGRCVHMYQHTRTWVMAISR